MKRQLWSPEKLNHLADTWPALADQKLSLGDATIKDVAEYYAQMRYHVEILTGDQGLKAYEPAAPVTVPRRKQRRCH
jgi:cytochrome c553